MNLIIKYKKRDMNTYMLSAQSEGIWKKTNNFLNNVSKHCPTISTFIKRFQQNKAENYLTN